MPVVDFKEGKKDHIKHLIRSGVIDRATIPRIADVVYTKTFARLCTYVVALNDRASHINKDQDPRDAYAQCASDIIDTMEKLIQANKEI